MHMETGIKRIVAGSAAGAVALMLAATSVAFAQTNNMTGTGVYDPVTGTYNTTSVMSSTTGTGSVTGTGATTATSGSTGTSGTGTSGTGTSGTPGVPNTGSGGNAFGNMMALAVSGLAAIAGLAYLAQQRSATR
jgi:hypothetical protein